MYIIMYMYIKCVCVCVHNMVCVWLPSIDNDDNIMIYYPKLSAVLYVRGVWSHNASFFERLKFNIERELANAK